MILNTRGIVLNKIKYSETSLICKIYTEKAGLQSFLIRGARKKNASIRSSQLQHLSLVDIVVDQKPNRELHYLKSVKVDFPFKAIPFDIVKSSIVFFINEVLYKVLKEEEEVNIPLFEFLNEAIQTLDGATDKLALFHHLFLIRLSRFLGFFPQNNYSALKPNFYLEEGAFTATPGMGRLIIEPPLSTLLSQLLQTDIHHRENLGQALSKRNELLEILMDYYKVHLPGLGDFKSYPILKVVFDA